MFCQNCGAKLEDNTKFCSNCGSAVIKDNNPYAQVAPTPTVYSMPTAPTAPPVPPAPTYGSQPQYLRPVQTPMGVQYVPAEPIVSYKKPEPKFNPFVFISAGVMGLMLLLCFLPWFSVSGDGFNVFRVFSDNIYLEEFEMDAAALCSIMMVVAMGLLTPSLILALVRKNQLPLGFSIAASVITLISLFFLLALVFDSKGDVEFTYVPLMMSLLSVANIIFPCVARKIRG